MSTTKRIILASPLEPSGVTWLINCFLELGIRCFRGSSEAMWHDRSGLSTLRDREDQLKRWLPALGRDPEAGFGFRHDVEVLWHHEWPDWRHAGLNPLKPQPIHKVIYFVRDPRDALYSRYRRDNPDLSLAEYANTIDCWSLLNRTDNWGLFTRTWVSRPDAVICRFEDYKRDPEATLTAVLDAIGLPYAQSLIRKACEGSSFQKARAAEQAWLERNPEHRTVVINRAGQVGSWGELTGDDAAVMRRLVERNGDLFARFGYEQSGPEHPDFSEHMAQVAWLRATENPPRGGTDPAGTAAGARAEALNFAETLSEDFFTRADLAPNIRAGLLCSLQDDFGADVAPLLAGFETDAAAWRIELLKRTRDPRLVGRIDPRALAKRVSRFARRALGR